MAKKNSIEFKAINNLIYDLVTIVDIKNLTKGAEKVRKSLYEITEAYIGHMDEHTTAWLEAHGHPYAKRNPHPPHKEPFIHIQGEKLIDAFINNPNNKTAKVTNSGFEVEMGIPDSVTYFKYLKYGTSRMIPRDIGGEILSLYKDKIDKMISSVANDMILSSKLRGQGYTGTKAEGGKYKEFKA